MQHTGPQPIVAFQPDFDQNIRKALAASPALVLTSFEQRDQIGFAIGYHLQLARNFVADFGYRNSGYFYNNGRSDLNQVFSLALRYYLTSWAAMEGFMSGAINNSNRSAFDYDVFTSGGGVGLTIRF